ncbi:hypothetical protein BLA29_009283 [Euroglyphus maynei]|uniref:Kinesin-associated microtubule-binding domain-containing protein n=1 Tax=Euroglyphus maynei TaxID=6958 RepID=A0A1Y3BJI6_EURMA|nr:hypothetical protein BLA29_009283 [Euroglyphus maynei]
MKEYQEKIRSNVNEFEVKLFTNVDHTAADFQEQAKSINQTIDKNVSDQRVHIDDLHSKSHEMIVLNRSELENLFKLISEQSSSALNNNLDVKNSIRALKISHDMEMDELNKTADKLVTNYLTYQTTGMTPKRCQYSYPQTFTPTSPHERILSRFHHTTTEQTSLNFSENDDNDLMIMNNGNDENRCELNIGHRQRVEKS